MFFVENPEGWTYFRNGHLVRGKMLAKFSMVMLNLNPFYSLMPPTFITAWPRAKIEIRVDKACMLVHIPCIYENINNEKNRGVTL